MKKFLYLFLAATGLAFFAGCGKPSATLSGCVEGGANAKITLLHQGATAQRLLDTLRADANGCFRYKIKQNGKTFDPMFVSVSADDAAVATLLIEKAGSIKLNASKGAFNYTVEGSEASELLRILNSNLYQSSHRFDSLTNLVKAEQQRTGTAAVPEQLARELSNIYIQQYRLSARFIAEHPASLASVAALHERLPNGLPVFSRDEDAIRFKIVYDSLSVHYPRSEYVLALRDEYEQRFSRMSLMDKINSAPETGFVDIELPNTTAQKVALSSLKGHVILVYFWASTDKRQLLYNNELKELYDRYHEKGFTIYQVSLDTDKAIWAKAVTTQALPWVNVCDGLGTASPAVRSYNIQKLPAAFLINKNGDLVASNIPDDDISKRVGELLR